MFFWELAFSRLATSRSSWLVGKPWKKVSTPETFLLRLELAWIEINRSAPNWLAIAVRSSRGIKLSLLRVRNTSVPRRSSSTCLSWRETVRTKFFSLRPSRPIVPESRPPWPGSITIRPTFKPKTLVRLRLPSILGIGTTGGTVRTFSPVVSL